MSKLEEKRTKIEEKRDILEKIKKEMEGPKVKEALAEANKVIKNYHKRNVAQGACSLALGAILSTLTMKALNAGYPFYVDDIKYYQEIETTIDEDGNIEEKKEGYNIPERLSIENEIDKEVNLYNYSTWGQTLTEESIRYIEKYSVGDLTAKEIVDLLVKKELDLESLGEPEFIQDTNGLKDSSTNIPYIGIRTVDTTDFMWDKESSERNFVISILFILSTVGFGMISASSISYLYGKFFKESSLFFNVKDCQVEIAKEVIEEYNQQVEIANRLGERLAKLERNLK